MGLIDMRDGSFFIPLRYLYIDTASFFDSTLNVVRVMSTFGTFKNHRQGDEKSVQLWSYVHESVQGWSCKSVSGWTPDHQERDTERVFWNHLHPFRRRSILVWRICDDCRTIFSANRSSNPDGFIMCAGGQWALIGQDGKYVIHPTKEKEDQIAFLEGVGNGYTVFRKNELYGIMDARGKVTLKDEHLWISRMSSGDSVLFTVLSKKSKYRYYHSTGQALLEESFDRGLPFTDDITWVAKGEAVHDTRKERLLA